MRFASITKAFTALSLFALQLYAQPNGLPNISTRTQSSSHSWIVSADFLAWFASQEPFTIWADVVTVGLNTSSFVVPGFNFTWDYGFRIGIGGDLAYDQWETALSWTWFLTDAFRPLPSIPEIEEITPEFYAAFLSGDKPQNLSVKWTLFLNMIDWELGRSYWVSKDLSLRPFVGLKGGVIHQSIVAKYHNLIINSIHTNNSGKEHLKNNFWGIGPSGGMNTKWRVRNFGSHFFDFFGDFSVATMWGTWSCSDRYRNTLPKTSFVNTKDSSLGALMFRGFMGIGWDVDIRDSHFAAKLGYEMQLWLNQLRIATFQLQRLHFDLTLQGVTLNCRYDF